MLESLFDPTQSTIISSALIFGIFKIMVLIGLGVYGVFALTMVSQVRLMTKTLQTGINGLLGTIALLHLFFMVGLWIFAFFTL